MEDSIAHNLPLGALHCQEEEESGAARKEHQGSPGFSRMDLASEAVLTLPTVGAEGTSLLGLLLVRGEASAVPRPSKARWFKKENNVFVLMGPHIQ